MQRREWAQLSFVPKDKVLLAQSKWGGGDTLQFTPKGSCFRDVKVGCSGQGWNAWSCFPYARASSQWLINSRLEEEVCMRVGGKVRC